MAGRELDPQRAKAARDVVRQHPLMSLAVVSPALIVAGLVWWLVNPTLAILLLLGAGFFAASRVLRK
ncbi:MAG: hypothetical protein WCH82_02945 [Mycobacteriaceae bacterium]